MFRIEMPEDGLIDERFFESLHDDGIVTLIKVQLVTIWTTDSEVKAKQALETIKALLLGFHIGRKCDLNSFEKFISVHYMKIKRV